MEIRLSAVALGGIALLIFGLRLRRHAYAIILEGGGVGILYLHGDADPLPLPYLPLRNPLDISEALVMLSLANWHLRRQESDMRGVFANQAVIGVIALLLFVWINAIALRTILFWFDVPYAFDDLWHSRLVQAVLSLLWATAALGTMLLANRRLWRVAWMAGAALLGLVVAKLFLVESRTTFLIHLCIS